MRLLGAALALTLASCGPKLMHGITPAAPAAPEEVRVAAPSDEALREQAEILATSLNLEIEDGYFKADARVTFKLKAGEEALYLFGDPGFLKESVLIIGEHQEERRLSPISTDREGLYALKIPRGVSGELTLSLHLEGPLDDERAPLVRVRDGGSEYWIPARNQPFLRPLFLDLDHLGGAARFELSMIIDDRLHAVGSLPIASRGRAQDKKDGRDRVVFEAIEGALAQELVVAIGPFDKISQALRTSGEGSIGAQLFATRGRGVQLAPTADELNRAIAILERFRGAPLELEELRLLVSPFFHEIPFGLLVLDEETGLAHSQRGNDRADLFTITRAIAELTLRARFAPLTEADGLLLWAMAYRESLDAIELAEPQQRMSEFFARSVERRKRFAGLGDGLDEFRLISIIEAIVEERGEGGYRALFEGDEASGVPSARIRLSAARVMEELGEEAPALSGLARVAFERDCTDGASLEASILSGPKTRLCVAIEDGRSEERRCFTLDPEAALPETIALPRCDARFAPNLEGFGFYRSRLPKEMVREYLRGRFETANFAERAAFYHDAVDAAEYGEIDAKVFEEVLTVYARSEDPLVARLPLRDLGRLLDELSDQRERAWVASLLERFYLARFQELGFEGGGGEFDEALRGAIGEQLFRSPRDEALKKELLVRARAYLGLGSRIDSLALAPGLIAPALVFAMGAIGEEAIDAVLARFRQTVSNQERGRLFEALLSAEHPLAAGKVRELALEPVLAKGSVLAILGAQLRRSSSRRDALEFIREESAALSLEIGERSDVELALLAAELCEDVALAEASLPLSEARAAGYEREVEFALARASSCSKRMRHLREVNAELAAR